MKLKLISDMNEHKDLAFWIYQNCSKLKLQQWNNWWRNSS